jgi:hypothetical protein
LLTICLKQIKDDELTEKTNELKKLWQPLKYELQKYFNGAYGTIEFDYGFTTENGKTITTYQPHAHYWLTTPKSTHIDTDALEQKITNILEKHLTGTVKTSVEIHQHFNAVEKAGYVHKWLFIGNDNGNAADTPKTENELTQNALILATLYEASKRLRPLYFGVLSNRTDGRIYNDKIKEKTINTEKENTDTPETVKNTPENEKTAKDTDGRQTTHQNANKTLLTAILLAMLLTRRIREKPR